MSIATLDDLIAAYKQTVGIIRMGALTTVGNGWFRPAPSGMLGWPYCGYNSPGNTTNGALVSNTSASGGYALNAFLNAGSGGQAYLTKAVFNSTVIGVIRIIDRIYEIGSFTTTGSATPTSPSWSARVPFKADGTTPDYTGCEIWAEATSAITGSMTVTVQYTDDAGTAQTTGAQGIGSAPSAQRCWQLPLAGANGGVKSVTNVSAATITAGTWNVWVCRHLATARVRNVNDAVILDFMGTGMPEILSGTALDILVRTDSTSMGIPDFRGIIASK